MKYLIHLILVSLLLSIGSCNEDIDSSKREVISLDNSTAGRPYSPAVKVGNTLYVSGQIAVDPTTGKLLSGDITAQTLQVLTNLQAVVEKAGFRMDDIVKCNVLMDSIEYYAPMNRVYLEFFPENPPARKAYAVQSLPLGAMVEIDAIAIK